LTTCGGFYHATENRVKELPRRSLMCFSYLLRLTREIDESQHPCIVWKETSQMKPSILTIAVLLMVVPLIRSQQQADPTFDAGVAHPAYTTSHPKVLFDEAHFNFHTSTGRYKPFASLITNDGYQVTANKVLSPQNL